MSLRTLVEDYLKEEKLFRERKNKNRGIVNLLINRYGLHYAIQRGEITKDRIIALVEDYASMDRQWRKILEETPELRGSDYDDKEELEINAMKGLGYNVPRLRKKAIKTGLIGEFLGYENAPGEMITLKNKNNQSSFPTSFPKNGGDFAGFKSFENRQPTLL